MERNSDRETDSNEEKKTLLWMDKKRLSMEKETLDGEIALDGERDFGRMEGDSAFRCGEKGSDGEGKTLNGERDF
jgi:hypothetical protein